MSVCIVGAGVIGLSTAVGLQEIESRASITLVAEKFSPETTSDVAAGIWRPYCLPDPRESLIKKWGYETFQHVEALYNEDPLLYGVGRHTALELFHVKEPIPYWCDTVHGFHHMDSFRLARMGWPDYSYAHSYITYWIESARYLPTLMETFKRKGGKVITKHLNSFDELPVTDVIVNCTGLGARNLVNDTSMFPIRGQIYRVHCPGLKHAISGGDNYILPNHDGMYVLGGTHQDNDWNTGINQADSKFIWDGCVKLAPILKNAKIIKQQVGLRPGRPSIRLECETMKVGAKQIPVVHNYGHGGSGLTLHWGCANEAAALAKSALHSHSAAAQLAKI